MRRTTLWVVTLSFVAWPAMVAADPIRLVVDGRFVESVVGVRDDFGHEFRDDEGKFGGGDELSIAVNASLPQGHVASGVATLSSSLSDLHHLSGVGAITATATVPFGALRSSQSGVTALEQFFVSFQLDTPHDVDFSVQFTGTEARNEDGLFSSVPTFFAVVALEVPENRVIFSHEGFGQFREKASLAPGRYFATVEMIGTASNTLADTVLRAHSESSFTVDLNPTPTPEPASLVLLGSGVLGLLATSRRGLGGNTPSIRR
jgi:hypothetical protein